MSEQAASSLRTKPSQTLILESSYDSASQAELVILKHDHDDITSLTAFV